MSEREPAGAGQAVEAGTAPSGNDGDRSGEQAHPGRAAEAAAAGEETCRYPGCARPTEAATPGEPGRPPAYCDDPGHTRGSAWRARRAQRAQASGDQLPEDLGRPVEMARTRAAELLEQAQRVAAEQNERFARLSAELATMADPDAVAAQIEAVSAEATQQVAEASARATRSEGARRDALDRARDASATADEANAAAEEAWSAHETLTAELGDTRARLGTAETQVGELQASIERLEAEAAANADAHDQAIVALTDQRDHAQAETTAVRAELASTTQRAEAAETAERQASATAEAARERSEDLRGRLERAEQQASEARDTAATARAERDAAREQIETTRTGERDHAEQRLADQRAGYEERLNELRDQLAAGTQTTRDTDTATDHRPEVDDAGAARSRRPDRPSARRGRRSSHED